MDRQEESAFGGAGKDVSVSEDSMESEGNAISEEFVKSAGCAEFQNVVYRVAAASSDGIMVNKHFGAADTFYIYEVDETGRYRLLEKRTVQPVCRQRDHDDSELQTNIGRLKDCKYILTARIGAGAASVVEQSGITPMELPGLIEDSIGRLNTYERLQNLFS